MDVDRFGDIYIWKDGLWTKGLWFDGVWKNGKWIEGHIWNPETKEYEPSKVPPNECKWSLSYSK